jgi:hypothetical protein
MGIIIKATVRDRETAKRNSYPQEASKSVDWFVQLMN